MFYTEFEIVWRKLSPGNYLSPGSFTIENYVTSLAKHWQHYTQSKHDNTILMLLNQFQLIQLSDNLIVHELCSPNSFD